MTWEVAIVIALLVLSLIVPLGRALVRAAEEARRAEPEPRLHRLPPTRVDLDRTATRRRPAGPRAVPANRAVTARMRPRPWVIANPMAMRRGIVLMTVLGPCRGLELVDRSHRLQ